MSLSIPFQELHIAEVVDNNDPKKEGRIKIFIPLFMGGYNADHLPWARPFFNCIGGDSLANVDNACYVPQPENPANASHRPGQSFIPEIETTVWVWFEDPVFLKNPYYLTGLQIEGNSPHSSFGATAVNKLQGENLGHNLVYPDVKYLYLKNQSTYFMSSSEKFPEGGYYFSDRSYFYAKEDRTTSTPVMKARLKSGTNNSLDLSYDGATSTPSMKLTSGSHKLEKMCLAETLKQKLENLCDALTNATLASPMGPLPFNPGLSTLSQIQQFKTDLSQILSDHIENN